MVMRLPDASPPLASRGALRGVLARPFKRPRAAVRPQTREIQRARSLAHIPWKVGHRSPTSPAVVLDSETSSRRGRGVTPLEGGP